MICYLGLILWFDAVVCDRGGLALGWLVNREMGIDMVLDIWRSFRAMPLWVQVWVFVILVPVNMFSVVYWAEPNGVWIAVLAIGAMALNGVIMLVERGFSKAMALPHVVIWTPLVIWIGWMLVEGDVAAGFGLYLVVLLVVDLISLAFDFKDTKDWLAGERSVAC